MSILAWIVLGLIAGFLASAVMRGGVQRQVPLAVGGLRDEAFAVDPDRRRRGLRDSAVVAPADVVDG